MSGGQFVDTAVVLPVHSGAFLHSGLQHTDANTLMRQRLQEPLIDCTLIPHLVERTAMFSLFLQTSVHGHKLDEMLSKVGV